MSTRGPKMLTRAQKILNLIRDPSNNPSGIPNIRAIQDNSNKFEESLHQEERIILIVEKNHVDNELHPFESDGVKNPIFIATSQEESITDEVTNNIMENRSYNYQREEESNMENKPEPLRDADENKTNFIQTSEKENHTTDEETKDMTQNEIDNHQREDENAIESKSVTDQENYVDSEPEPFGDNSDDDPEFIPTSEDESDRDEETNNMENETDNDQREEKMLI
ncbi:unnamed protein product [Psylliodes chrysocephalus]|uniref:Uncharacterized protein n=1 Tax=Psylliodes chrysocephalus TaxID=3402493 RepID=A0A9P0CKF7_9CUCU|nr:unnamed protein product [Psylliodes chrysocephala]